MWNKDNIQDELRKVAPALAGMGNKTPYRVDDAYFQNLSSLIISKINGERNFVFDNQKHTAPFTTPAGYFEGLADNILASVRSNANKLNEVEQELAEIAPVLAKLPKTNVYNVPGDYFDNLKVIQVIQPAAKVVSMYTVRKAFRYVAAAIVIGIMVIAGFLFFDKPDVSTSTAGINVSVALDQLSEEDILSYLQEPATAMEINSFTGNLPESDQEFEEAIDELSDDELQQYLKLYPEPITTPKSGI